MIDYKKYIVLYVDDEEKSLKNFARAYGHVFRIKTAPTAVEGLKILQDQAARDSRFTSGKSTVNSQNFPRSLRTEMEP